MPSKRIVVPEEGTYILDEITKIKVRKCPAYVSKNPSVATLERIAAALGGQLRITIDMPAANG